MATIVRYARNGLEYSDGAQRTGSELVIVGGVAGDGLAALLDALGASGMPARLSEHPDVSGLYLLSRTPVARAPGRVHVRLEWGPLPVDEPETAPAGTWMQPRLRALAGTRETTVDKDGTPMVLNYTGATGAAFSLKHQLVEVEVPGNGYVLEVDQVLAGGAVAAAFATYRGKVNATTWNGAARTWLCSDDLSAEPIRGTSNYLARWTFIYNPATWDHTQRVRLGGLVPNDAVSDGGQGTWRVLSEVDFTPLAVTLP